MIPRLFSILIIGFWLVMTSLLMRAIWFPEHSRLDAVNPGAVVRLVAARGEPSHLDIYEGRKIVGRLNVTPLSPPIPGGTDEVLLHLDGHLELRLPARRLMMSGKLAFNHGGGLTGMDLTLSMRAPKLKLTLKQASGQEIPVARLLLGGTLLFDSSQIKESDAGMESNPTVMLLLGLMGMSPAEFDQVRQAARREADATAVDARQGDFEIEGVEHHGYLLSVLKNGASTFRVYVENTGQILSIETPTSYRLLSEAIAGDQPE
ncbi:MAG: hypothetical protein EOP86_01995 [Verrucomicrobiaceae bacterium]|nr:MAG: hypothetical protein EOP86_01995 [Verrucomicrobiaceae bacterium]